MYQGDLYQPLPGALRGRVDILVANAPYVPTEEIDMMPPEARLFEPPVALDGGPDGLDLQRQVTAGAPEWLAPDGHLLIETSERQAPTTLDIFVRAGLAARIARSDELSATVVIGARSDRWHGNAGVAGLADCGRDSSRVTPWSASKPVGRWLP